MALTELVKRLQKLHKTDPRFKGLKLRASSRLILSLEYGVEPTDDEVAELAQATREMARNNLCFFDDWDFEQENNDKEFQTGGGRRVVHKCEPMGG